VGFQYLHVYNTYGMEGFNVQVIVSKYLTVYMFNLPDSTTAITIM